MIKELLFFAVFAISSAYYSRKKRFEVLYASFLSIFIAALLKILVSDNLSITSAPPSLGMTFLSSLSVFNPAVWWVTLAYLMIIVRDGPIAAVSGLLLGYGLGSWHRMRRRKIIIHKGEVKRKVIHALGGLGLAVPPFLLDRWVALGVFVAGIAGILLFRFVKPPVIKDIVEETRREKEWPLRGTFYYLLGSLVPIYIGQPWILLVLAIGDGLSTLVGKFFGYTPLYKKKSVEGTLAGFIAAWAVIQHFYQPAAIPAAIYLLAELFAPIDDNLVIPLSLSALYLI